MIFKNISKIYKRFGFCISNIESKLDIWVIQLTPIKHFLILLFLYILIYILNKQICHISYCCVEGADHCEHIKAYIKAVSKESSDKKCDYYYCLECDNKSYESLKEAVKKEGQHCLILEHAPSKISLNYRNFEHIANKKQNNPDLFRDGVLFNFASFYLHKEYEIVADLTSEEFEFKKFLEKSKIGPKRTEEIMKFLKDNEKAILDFIGEKKYEFLLYKSSHRVGIHHQKDMVWFLEIENRLNEIFTTPDEKLRGVQQYCKERHLMTAQNLYKERIVDYKKNDIFRIEEATKEFKNKAPNYARIHHLCAFEDVNKSFEKELNIEREKYKNLVLRALGYKFDLNTYILLCLPSINLLVNQIGNQKYKIISGLIFSIICFLPFLPKWFTFLTYTWVDNYCLFILIASYIVLLLCSLFFSKLKEDSVSLFKKLKEELNIQIDNLKNQILIIAIIVLLIFLIVVCKT